MPDAIDQQVVAAIAKTSAVAAAIAAVSTSVHVVGGRIMTRTADGQRSVEGRDEGRVIAVDAARLAGHDRRRCVNRHLNTRMKKKFNNNMLAYLSFNSVL